MMGTSVAVSRNKELAHAPRVHECEYSKCTCNTGISFWGPHNPVRV